MDHSALNLFLASVEKRAFRMARLATRQDADALDIVQEAMTRLVTHYRDAEASEWKPLFYRILENCLNDWHRQNTRRQRWGAFRRWLGTAPEDTHADECETWPELAGSNSPVSDLARQRQQEAMMTVLESLPLQQQQCFLLRCWEGMSVQETADAMGISPGSVKTHLHRAKQKLNQTVEEHDVQSLAG